MPTCYEQADDAVHEMAREVLEKHHPDLRLPDKSHVRLCLLMAYGDDEEEPAVKCHGYPAQAKISVIPLKQRVDKRADAEIIIDRKNWEDLTEPRQRALLDHEIEHLEIQKDENGFVKTDDIGRPKLKLRLHDFDFGGFRAVARRHGDDAPEVRLARQFEQDFGDDVLRKGELYTGR
jgi:hypothetical protein